MSIPQFSVWDSTDCLRVHEASLALLEDPGVEVKYGPAVEVLADLGARIEGTRVKIGADLVDRALSLAPRQATVRSRDHASSLSLAQGQSYFGPGSDCLYITDPGTGLRRRAVLTDVEGIAALCERLENIDFVMSMGLPEDVPQAIDDIAQVAAMLRGTRKPLLVAPRNGAVLPAMREMAALCGQADSLMIYAMPSPPLMHDEDALSKVIGCAELGIPLIYAPAPATGGTGPASLASVITVGNAEVLSGLVVHQAVAPGAPFVYGAGCGILNLRTALDVYAVPEHFLGNQAACELARYYGLPSFAYASVSDSKCVDEQLCAEYAFTALLGALSRATLLHDVGYMESGLRSSYETVILGNELVGFARAFMRDCRVDSESLAVAEIVDVGPGGNHLARPLTRAAHRGYWQPDLIDHSTYDRWHAGGERTLATRMRARRDELLAGERPFRLSEDTSRQLDGLLTEAMARR
jgi:trimethylamine---corrinoid protein Co-methyltransferase